MENLILDVKVEETMPTKIINERFIKVGIVGVGGGGCNMLNYMIEQKISRVDLIAINTDLQHLSLSPAPKKIQIGKNLTKGQGAGSNPEIGKESALESKDEIAKALNGLDIIFIAAGMGGGTGTGAGPIVANIAKELGVRVVSVVTKPFEFEGRKRMAVANDGYEKLKNESDAIIVIKNEKVADLGSGLTMQEAYRQVNNILYQAVSGLIDVILNVSQDGTNADFADVKNSLDYRGLALMSIGYGKGENAALDAVEDALNSPLLDNVNLSNAKSVIAHWTHNPNIIYNTVSSAMKDLVNRMDEYADVKHSTFVNKDFQPDEVKLIIIATGFEVKQDIKVDDNKTNIKIYDKSDYDIPPLMRGYEIKYHL